MRRMVKIIDDGGFSKRLFFVGASGFLASSYSLFATNVIKPELYYVYPPCGRLAGNAGMVMDELMLVGTALGMLLAGHLADLWGRKRLYGWELAILIAATIGVAQSSEGFRSPTDDRMHSTDIYSWLAWWRFVLGVGIGAEYPLVAIITAEWVATRYRGLMLAAVFAMLPLARLLAFGVGLAALKIASNREGMSPDLRLEDDTDQVTKIVADQVWRWVIGFAVIPAALAVGLRFTIPEPPRYYAHILKDTSKGVKKALEVYSDTKADGKRPATDQAPANTDSSDDDGMSESSEQTRGWKGWLEWCRGARLYLGNTRAGRHLAVIAVLWALTDIAWYCLSMDSPSSMSTLWADPSSSSSAAAAALAAAQSPAPPNTANLCPESNSWKSDPSDPDATIYRELERNSTRFMVIVSIGSLLGNLALVCGGLVDRFHRKRIMTVCYLALAVLFGICGAILLSTGPRRHGHDSHVPPGLQRLQQDPHPAVHVLFGIMHFFFTVGPRTLVFILAVEMFPTVYRGTFYGIAAAVGKVGAIVIRPVIGRTSRLPDSLGIRLLVVVPLMVAAAGLCWFLPCVQRVSAAMGEDEEEKGEGGKETEGGRAHGTELGGGDDGGNSDGREAAGAPSRPRPRQGWRKQWLGKLDNMKLEEIAVDPESLAESIREPAAAPSRHAR